MEHSDPLRTPGVTNPVESTLALIDQFPSFPARVATLISAATREKKAATRGGQRGGLYLSVSFTYSKRTQPLHDSAVDVTPSSDTRVRVALFGSSNEDGVSASSRNHLAGRPEWPVAWHAWTRSTSCAVP